MDNNLSRHHKAHLSNGWLSNDADHDDDDEEDKTKSTPHFNSNNELAFFSPFIVNGAARA